MGEEDTTLTVVELFNRLENGGAFTGEYLCNPESEHESFEYGITVASPRFHEEHAPAPIVVDAATQAAEKAVTPGYNGPAEPVYEAFAGLSTYLQERTTAEESDSPRDAFFTGYPEHIRETVHHQAQEMAKACERAARPTLQPQSDGLSRGEIQYYR